MLEALLKSYQETARDIDDWISERFGPLKILFVVSDPYGFACQAPVIRALQRLGTAFIRVTVDDPAKAGTFTFESADDQILFESLSTPYSAARRRKWHYLVSTHLNGFHPIRRTIRVYMHHGPGFGILGEKLHVALRNDLFFGLSETERDYLESLQPGLFGANRAFIPIGFPKSDALVQGAFPREQTLQRLNLPQRPTLLITSHWRGPALLLEMESRAFECLARAYPDHNVIQTGHPWVWQQSSQIDNEWRVRLLKDLDDVQTRYANARFIPTSDVEPLLAAADLMVGDHSSVMTTYSLLDRPILFYNPKGSEFVNNSFLDLYRDASHSFETTDELIASCKTALASPNEKSRGRASMRSTFYANSGHAADTAARILLRLGKIGGTRSKKWTRIAARAEPSDERKKD